MKGPKGLLQASHSDKRAFELLEDEGRALHTVFVIPMKTALITILIKKNASDAKVLIRRLRGGLPCPKNIRMRMITERRPSGVTGTEEPVAALFVCRGRSGRLEAEGSVVLRGDGGMEGCERTTDWGCKQRLGTFELAGRERTGKGADNVGSELGDEESASRERLLSRSAKALD